MWQQQPSKPKSNSPKNIIIMWSNRGTAKSVQEKEVKEKLADGWIVAEEETSPGTYNPIYDRGDIRVPHNLTPSNVSLPERNVDEEYLKVIQV